MPIYRFKCSFCGHVTERDLMIDNRDDEIDCICGNLLTRLFDIGGVVFKGKGWAKND